MYQCKRFGSWVGFARRQPATGLLTKTQPNPRVGFWWAGLGSGRVLARPKNTHTVAHTCAPPSARSFVAEHLGCEDFRYSIFETVLSLFSLIASSVNESCRSPRSTNQLHHCHRHFTTKRVGIRFTICSIQWVLKLCFSDTRHTVTMPSM
jgi:hypothetical protein